jgi:glycerate 2-kinase
MQVGVRQPHLRYVLTTLLQSGLQAVQPGPVIRRIVRVRTGRRIILTFGPRQYTLSPSSRLVVVGAGKAAGSMAASLEQALGPRLADRITGLVIVKDGHSVPTERIRLIEAGHPVPDEAGQQATEALLDLISGLTSRDLVIVLLTGGASSLLVAPAPGLTLADKRRTTELLLRSGATIQELNAVRKHLSVVKGGRLLACTQARVISLILSDVLGDDLATIGSGPTVPDPSRFQEACSILERYELWGRIPSHVRRHLTAGRAGRRPETPKPGAPMFRRVHNLMLGNNRAAVEAVAQAAKRLGLRPLVLSSTLTGEAREAARLLGALAREISETNRPVSRPACLIAGGELTVTVRGGGTGGRAQEFALAVALEIAGLRNIWVASCGTDGTDGPTPAAGAVVDGGTYARARRAGIDLSAALQRNDAYPALAQLNGLIVTGPTGTNVNDLYLLLAL